MIKLEKDWEDKAEKKFMQQQRLQRLEDAVSRVKP